jgi:hypothetical protein
MKKYYYHITKKRWGKEKLLTPKGQDEISDSNRSADEPDVPRICVAPELWGCFGAVPRWAITGSWKITEAPKYINVYVYRTKYKVIGTEPHGVNDQDITGEMWLIEPTEFIRVMTIKGEIVENMPKCFLAMFKHQLAEQSDDIENIKKYLKENDISFCP